MDTRAISMNRELIADALGVTHIAIRFMLAVVLL